MKKYIFATTLILLIHFSAFSTCPACLGSIGISLRGFASTSLTPWDLQVRYRYERQSLFSYYRNLNSLQLSFYHNFERFSFGVNLPFSSANGFMRDGKLHRVRALYGIDISGRFFVLKAPFTPSRPILSFTASFKVPIGYIYHEEHESVKIPYVLTFGSGYSVSLYDFIFAIEGYYSKVFNRDEKYHFGDRGSVYLTFLRFIPVSNKPIGLGFNFSFLWQDGDKSGHSEVFENTRRLTLDFGPRLIVPIFDNISVDIYAGYFILKGVNLPQDVLRSKFSIEAGFVVGF